MKRILERIAFWVYTDAEDLVLWVDGWRRVPGQPWLVQRNGRKMHRQFALEVALKWFRR